MRARVDADAVAKAILDTWTFPDIRPRLRERVAAMRQRAYEPQAGATSY